MGILTCMTGIMSHLLYKDALRLAEYLVRGTDFKEGKKIGMSLC